MYKYLEQERVNNLLMGLAQTALQVGLDKLEPTEAATLQLLYEQRNAAN